MKRIDCFVAVMILAMWSASASAATVTFTLEDGLGGTFTLYASASPGDNGGISSYGIPLTGPITSLNHRSPIGVSSTNFAPVGFSNLRSADNVTNVFAGQPLTGPAANYLYRIGQTANSFAGLGIPILGSADPTSDSAWTAPIVIATGTYDVSIGRPGFAPPTANLFSNLFATAGNSVDKIPANVSTQVTTVSLPFLALNNLGERDPAAGVITAKGIALISGTKVTWGNLQPVVGSGHGVPAIPATLDSDGNFRWDPTGSMSNHVLYQWTASAEFFEGFDSGLAFSVILVPEPSTVSIFTFAIFGLATVVRRR